MKIYSVKSDVNKYNWLIPEETGEELLTLNTFDCKRRLDTWTSPLVSVLNSKTGTADFLNYHPSVLLVSQIGRASCRERV